MLHPLLQRVACGLLAERVALLYGQDGRLGEVLCARVSIHFFMIIWVLRIRYIRMKSCEKHSVRL